MTMNRRELISGAIALGGVLLVPRWLRADDGEAASPRRTLVFLHLNGGNDGLNTVVPYADPMYRVLRPTLGIDAYSCSAAYFGNGIHMLVLRRAPQHQAVWRRLRTFCSK